jgi:hypothetical protein
LFSAYSYAAPNGEEITIVPPGVAQVGCAVTAITGVAGEITVIVIGFDVAGEPVAQVAVEVITTVTTFPFVSDVVVNVLPVPTLVVPIFH